MSSPFTFQHQYELTVNTYNNSNTHAFFYKQVFLHIRVYIYAFNEQIDPAQKASNTLIYAHQFGGRTFMYKYKISRHFNLLK